MTVKKYKVRKKTLEDVMVANKGDWVITGVNNEKYPCKPDIFHKTYDIIGVVHDT